MSHLLREQFNHLNTLAGGGVRWLGVALAALMLAYAGHLSQALLPWSGMALPAGLAVAASARWGLSVGSGAIVGVLLALLAAGAPIPAAMLAADCTDGDIHRFRSLEDSPRHRPWWWVPHRS